VGESVAPFYDGWRMQNARMVDVIANLSNEQLRLRAAPDKWPVWAIAGHTAGARVYWLCGVLKESGAETTPFTDPQSGEGWEDHEDHPRAAAELVGALESSWWIVERCLERWSPTMLADEFSREWNGRVQIHTRQSVLMRLLTHDAYHAGEISSILGTRGLPEIDLWSGLSRLAATKS
jgi:uncharacterized damage-inducible protein DinB